MSAVVGIDLGTTNTVVGVVQAGRAITVPNERGERLIPSVVSFHPNGSILVGREAKSRRLVDSKNTIYSTKRLIGRSFDSEAVQKARGRTAFEIREGPGQGPLVVARAETYTLPEISAFVLREAKRVAEVFLKDSVDRAVITVPANFNDLQRAATKVAGRIAGVEVIRILNEPTAAALAYGYGKGSSERIAIYDFGGGTFDVTLLDLAGNVFEVLATAGDTFLGGDDIDQAIAEKIVQEYLKKHRYDPRADPHAYEHLLAGAEHLKIQVSSTGAPAGFEFKDFAFGPGGKSLDLSFTLTPQDLNAIATPLVERTLQVCKDALSVARLKEDAFDQVVLVGGSTRIPTVRDLVSRFFNRKPLDRLNPDEVVALGAAIQAAALTGTDRRRGAGTGDRPSAPPPAPSGPPRRITGASGLPGDPRRGTNPGLGDGPMRTGAPVLAPPSQAAPDTLPRLTDPQSGRRVGPQTRRSAPPPPAIIMPPGGLLTTPDLPQPPQPAVPPVNQPVRKTLASEQHPLFSAEEDDETGVNVRSFRAADQEEATVIRPPNEEELRAAMPSRESTPDDERVGMMALDGFRPPPPLTPPAPPLAPPPARQAPADLPRGPKGTLIQTDDAGHAAQLAAAVAAATSGRQSSVPTATAPMPVVTPQAPTFLTPPLQTPPAAPPPAAPVTAPMQQTRFAGSPAQAPAPPPAAPVTAPMQQTRFAGSPAQAPASPMVIPPLAAPAPAPTPSRAAAPPPTPAPVPTPAPAAAARRQAAPLLIDVTPLSLSVETVGGYSDVIIERNTPVPCERTRLFVTASDNQMMVRVNVAQGESLRFGENVQLGQLELTGLRAAPRGETKIAVSFELDTDGILGVRAVDQVTGQATTAKITLGGAVPGAAEVAQMAERMRNRPS